MLMERRMNRHAKTAGLVAFVWRFALTTGTGSIFGFLVARQAYQSAVLAPMFIVMSFAWGLAVFLIVQSSMYSWNRIELDPAIQRRMARLLGLFVVAVLYFVAVHHLTNLYYARQEPFEQFILLDGGAYTVVFWVGYVLAGTVVPLALLFGGAVPERVRLRSPHFWWWKGHLPCFTYSSSAGRRSRSNCSPDMQRAAASSMAPSTSTRLVCRRSCLG
jgi:Ni/Fe-hydrogenase subunit HybB-like protein